jgi:hypothetical protein
MHATVACVKETTMKSSIRNTITLPLLALALLAPVRSETEPATLTLYHAFATDRSDRWTSVSVAVDPAAWRVGGPEGPVASRAQLDAVFASLGWVVVGATCPSASASSTHYPQWLRACRTGRRNSPWRSAHGPAVGIDLRRPLDAIRASERTGLADCLFGSDR